MIFAGCVIAARNAVQTPEIHVNGKVYELWPKGSGHSNTEVRKAVDGCQLAARLFLDRLEAELPEGDARLALNCFDLQLWRKSTETKRNGLTTQVLLWLKDLGFSESERGQGAREYRDAAPVP
jgi:hypothetical protein